MKRPLFISAVLGIIITIAVYYCHVAIFAAILILCLIALFAIYKKCFKKFAVIILACMCICAGLLYELSVVERMEQTAFWRIKEQFVITEEPLDYGSGKGAVAKCISGYTLKKGDKVRLYFSSADVLLGDTVSVTFTLKPLKKSVYKTDYYAEGVYASGSVEEIQSTDTDGSWLAFVPKLKKAVKNILNQSMSYENQAFVSALTVGDRNDFSDTFEEHVRNTGTSHIMVVSGMHLVILMGGLMSLLKRLFYNKYIFFAISLVGVLFLSAVCGFTMSIIRAGITYILIMAAPMFDRDSDSLNTLGATVTLVLMFSPFAVFSIAFQLSLLSTFGILITAPFIREVLCRRLRIKSETPKKIIEIISLTSAATLMTAPVCVYRFEQLSLVALFVNLCLTYAVTAVLLISAVGVIFALPFGVTPVSRLILSAADILSSLIVGFIDYVGSFKYSAIYLPKETAFLFVGLAAGVLLLKWIKAREDRRLLRKI